MKKLILCTFLIAAACAKNPDRIEPFPVTDNPYGQHSCAELTAEHTKLTKRLAFHSERQKKAAKKDAAGVFFVSAPLASLSGQDSEHLIAVTKGRIIEVERLQSEKHCALPA